LDKTQVSFLVRVEITKLVATISSILNKDYYRLHERH